MHFASKSGVLDAACPSCRISAEALITKDEKGQPRGVAGGRGEPETGQIMTPEKTTPAEAPRVPALMEPGHCGRLSLHPAIHYCNPTSRLTAGHRVASRRSMFSQGLHRSRARACFSLKLAHAKPRHRAYATFSISPRFPLRFDRKDRFPRKLSPPPVRNRDLYE